MSRHLVILFALVFTLRSVWAVPANTDINEVKEESEPTANQRPEANDNAFRRIVNSLPGIRLGRVGDNVSRGDIEALRQVIQESPAVEWPHKFPAPAVQETDCYVEVQVIKKIPGKCTKLGGRIPACQAKDLVTIDYNTCK